MNVSSVVTGSANPCNVYWRVGTSATLNGTTFIGTVIADASITVGGGIVSGRVLAGTGPTGAVTMPGSGGNTIGGCSVSSCPTITLAPATLPPGTVAVAYSQTIAGSGGTAPYTFGVTVGALPAGLTLTAAGVLAGTPTTVGISTFTIRGTDANGCFATLGYTIVIAAAPVPPAVCPPITLAPSTLANATVGVVWSQTLAGSGGTAPYSFGVTGGALPAGLTLTMAGTLGLLTGTPTVAGTSTFTIRGTDANGCFAELPFTLSVTTAVPTLPQAFVLLLALGLTTIGYFRLRRRARAE